MSAVFSSQYNGGAILGTQDLSGTTHNLTAGSDTQANTASTGSIIQSHALICASSVQDNIASASVIVQAHVLLGSEALQGNVASAGSITSGFTHVLTGASSAQGNTSSAGVVTQAHALISQPSIQNNVAQASAIVQAHMLLSANSAQGNIASTGVITSNAPGSAVYPTPDQVLLGVTYGPTGVEYTGILTAGTVYIEQILSSVVDDKTIVLLQDEVIQSIII